MSAGKSQDSRLPCPCCGARTLDQFGLYEICEVCHWEDDPSQFADPTLAGGANHLSLNEAQEAWLALQRKHPTS
ncbi:MAG: hypothetical protein K1X53_09415 [Candidatus Sumerlaeaceae bacterium]|nr:hypothetical protein [Candidatus Sumerlaeaceae bacterium]